MTLGTKRAAVEMERSWWIQGVGGDDSVQIAKWHKEI